MTKQIRKLTPEDVKRAADFLAVTTAHIRTILEVEAGNAGFDEAGNLKRLFEPHLFHKYTRGRYDRTHPHLSYPDWQPGNYKRNQVKQFEEAWALDANAAYLATSWGLPQILGSNFAAAGYSSAQEMVDHFEQGGEPEQLAGFVRLIDEWDLEGVLRACKWATFARRYNGKSYKKNDYDGKLKRAFAKWYAREGNPPLPASRKALAKLVTPSQINTPVIVPNSLPVTTQTALTANDPQQPPPPVINAEVNATQGGQAAATVEAPALPVSSPETPAIGVFLQTLKSGKETLAAIFAIILGALTWAQKNPAQAGALVALAVLAIWFYRTHARLTIDRMVMNINADPFRHNIKPDKNA